MSDGHRQNPKRDDHFLVGSDPWIRRRNYILTGLFIGVAGAVLFLWTVTPDFLIPAKQYIRELAGDLSEIEIRKNTSQIKLNDKNDFIKAVENGFCDQVVLHGINFLRSNPGEHWLRLKMAECHLFRRESADAFDILKPFHFLLLKPRDIAFNPASENQKLEPEALLLMIQSMIQRAQIHRVRGYMKRVCQSWQLSATCIGKLYYMGMVSGFQASGERGYQRLADQLGKTPENAGNNRMEYYLHLAGAVIASGMNQKHIANKRFFLGIKSVESKDTILLKMLYEEWIFALFYLNDQKYMNIVKQKALRYENDQDRRWITKINLLHKLITHPEKRTEFTVFLGKSENVVVLRQDYRLLNLISVYALKLNLGEFLLPMINPSRQFMMRNNASSEYILNLDQWYGRILLSTGKFHEAKQHFKKLLEGEGNKFISLHLMALAYYLDRPGRANLGKAYKLFALSHKSGLKWQSIYGKGKALLGLKKYQEAQKNLLNLRSFTKSDQRDQALWADLLQAELYLAKNKPGRSLKLVRNLLSRRKDFPEALELRARLVSVMGKHEKADEYITRANQIQNDQNALSWARQLQSPMSPLVFITRSYVY